MRITVINGSPKLNKGYTAQILEPLIEGMEQANAKVELIYASKLKIKPCIGEFHCWNTKLGECILSDDMQSLYKRLEDTDILVFATPVYIPLPGAMQNLLNRLCPLIEPKLEIREGRTRARFRKEVRIKKIMLVAISGWWELGNFDTVKRIVEEFAADVSADYIGAILRPHSSLLDNYPDKKKLITETLWEAGRELVKEGKIASEKIEIIAKPLISFEDFIKS